MRKIVWGIAAAALAAWSLLAWATHALVDGSADWLAGVAATLTQGAHWVQRLDGALGWAEGIGQFAVLAVWALGSVGLLLTAAFATLLLRRGEDALASAR